MITDSALRRYIKHPHDFRREQIILPNGARLGEVEEPWQTEHIFGPMDARDALGELLYWLVYLELARGHAKTATLAMVALTYAFLGGDIRIYFAASDQDQAGIAFEMLTGFIRRNPDLRRSFKIARNDITVPATGSSIKVLSSDAPTSYGLGGLAPHLLILCDELWTWRGRDLWDSLWSATAKAAKWRVVIGSNAGFDTSSVAWELRELCRQGVDDRFYLYSPPGVQASWIREKDLETQRRSLPPEVYQRLWENKWTEGSGSLITREQLDVCVDPDWRPQVAGRLFTNYSIGLDLGLTRDRTARCVVHRQPDGVVVVDSMKVWQGSRKTPVRIEEIEQDLLEVDEAFRHPRFSVDPWQLAGTAQRLESKLAISEFRFTSESVRRLSENLVRLITNGLLKLYPDPDLEHELLSLQMIQTSFGYRMDHRSGGFSDTAMALAMAALQVVESPITSSADIGRFDTLIEETRARGSERNRFADVVRIPGVGNYGYDRLNG